MLDRQTVEYGTTVRYTGKALDRTDERYTYRFLGWVQADGSAPENIVATRNISLYAQYDLKPVMYRITWRLDGNEIVKSCPYGIMPECPFQTERDPDERYFYTFSGWDTEPVAVTGDATYTASFLREARSYTVKWVLNGSTTEASYPFGELPVSVEVPDYVDSTYFYTFSGWDHPVAAVSGDVTYVAQYRKSPMPCWHFPDRRPQAPSEGSLCRRFQKSPGNGIPAFSSVSPLVFIVIQTGNACQNKPRIFAPFAGILSPR